MNFPQRKSKVIKVILIHVVPLNLLDTKFTRKDVSLGGSEIS